MLKQAQMSKIVGIMLFCMLLSFAVPVVYATDLNGVGSSETTTETTPVTPTTPVTQEPVVETKNGSTTDAIKSGLPDSKQNVKDVEDTANAIGNMFNEAGPKAEDVAAANEFIAPFAKILNKVMAVILGITSLLMMFITVLDMLYMAFPPIRDTLDGGRMGAANMAGGRGSGRGSRGMGMGGMRGGYGMNGGMGMGGMQGMNGMGMNGMGMGGGMQGMNGMGGMQNQQQQGGGLSAVGRWVSDEAIAACMESQGGVMQGQQMSGMPMKSMIFSYMKKRAMFLILFGVCVILFTSTVFTDLGIRVGTWILKIILGFGI